MRWQAVIAAVVALAFLATLAAAQAPQAPEAEVPAVAMLADLVVLRPFGLAALVLGTATFIAALPFSVPTKSVKQAARKLVVEPAAYTFARPLGQVDALRSPTP
ncbi:MAG: hypothetical protein KatS3mg131_1571 [Candidatus Tectimicrobiota bacterium]|nr:MAG: hypothetical protein KatS3mg131_1571 [Candidatus Tectomicrobia bacterium]